MRATTGVRTNPCSLSRASHPLYIHHAFPTSLCVPQFVPCPSLPLFLSSFRLPSAFLPSPSSLYSLSSLPNFHLIFPPALPHPFLPGITLVDETSPVDEPLNSDQVTEGVQFAYTLPQQQSNPADNQDTALVGVHEIYGSSSCSLCVFPSLHQPPPPPPPPPHTHTHSLLTQRV